MTVKSPKVISKAVMLTDCSCPLNTLLKFQRHFDDSRELKQFSGTIFVSFTTDKKFNRSLLEEDGFSENETL